MLVDAWVVGQAWARVLHRFQGMELCSAQILATVTNGIEDSALSANNLENDIWSVPTFLVWYR